MVNEMKKCQTSECHSVKGKGDIEKKTPVEYDLSSGTDGG